MAGRPKIYNEEQVLNSAVNLFWDNGYEATSTEDLLRVMHLNKGSLYHSFGSKRELFIKSMDYFAANSLKQIHASIRAAKNPIEGIRNFFMQLAIADDAVHQRGCFMGNSLAELSNIDAELKEKAIINLLAVENLFFAYISEAKKSGVLKTKKSARQIARYLLTLWNGINITRRIYPQKEMLGSIIKMQLEILK